MKGFLWAVLSLSALCLVNGCGGGSTSGGFVAAGSPSVSFSTNNLTFGDEVVGTASQPLPITLANTGTATLIIASISASGNFAETNDCGSTLAAGANCVINVTLTPNITGSVSGTVSFTDNAGGSPQTVSVSGTGVTGTTVDTLTGYCFGKVTDVYRVCSGGQDFTECPLGQLAVDPEYDDGFGCLGVPRLVDTSASCGVKTTAGPVSGFCVAQVSAQTGSCSVQGQECGASQLPPCCSGFVCAAASDRAFCQPATGAPASKARSSWDQGLADRLR
jgi:ASPM-SPD-2-Hydin domain-containing protein